MHASVLLHEVIDSFKGKKISTFIDCTLGAGGHSAHILKDHPEIQALYGFDQDPLAFEIAKEKLQEWQEKVHYIYANFENLKPELEKKGIRQTDGILIDLGVSSMQLDIAEKGFSFSQDGPLDMRMDPNNPLTAEEIINMWPVSELGRIFRQYGEEKEWRYAAMLIEKARAVKPLRTTFDLVEALQPLYYKKKREKKGIHPLTLIFQAIRIAVNKELEVVEKTIPQAIELLAPGGRLAVISFHSLEDRIVKNLFREAASDKVSTSGIGGMFLDKEPLVKLITGKPLVASDQELAKNPRSRSAKLRVIEKLNVID